MSSIFPIEVEDQRACNYEPLFETVLQSEVIAGVTAYGFNPFSYDPEAIGPLGYTGDVKIRERSEPLKRWMKGRV